MQKSDVKRQAELLAKENRQSDAEISKVYWFPDENEVRLVELHSTIPLSNDGHVHPFFFKPSPSDDLPAPTGVALITPDEFRKLKLPPDWGDWDSAVELEDEE